MRGATEHVQIKRVGSVIPGFPGVNAVILAEKRRYFWR